MNEKKRELIERLANEVLAGKWGNGLKRKRKLRAAGWEPSAVQAKVNEIIKRKKT